MTEVFDQEFIWGLSLRQALELYDHVWKESNWPAIAELGRKDRFFLLTYLLGRQDAIRPWIYERCREVERDPDNHLDLWSREHYKSTIITYTGSIQEILKDPEITIGIFSFNRASARKFVKQIKYELEANEKLKQAYPDILWEKPDRDAPTWSEERGIVVRRKSNPREATVEGHGLIEGMPTGMHYRLRVYDDVVTEDAVTTPEQIEKVTNAWRLSLNLGSEGGRVWYIGTRYHFNDTYRVLIDERVAQPRIYPGTIDGTPDGEPVLFSEEWMKDRRNQGAYIFSCQILQNPVADEAQGFKKEWIQYYENNDPKTFKGMNRYILVDPASEKKKHSDYTAMFVVGLNLDQNYYVLDMVRDRMNLTERANTLFRLHRKWKPRGVGYEKYGKDSDIEHIEHEMKSKNYRFSITPLGGTMRKEDRIRRLVPVCEQGRLWLPESLFATDYKGQENDLVKDFVEQEVAGFPVAVHDDMLDCLSRIMDDDMYAVFPQDEQGDYFLGEEEKPDRYRRPKRRRTTWMAA